MIQVSDGNFCYFYLVLGFCQSSVHTLMHRSENEQAQLREMPLLSSYSVVSVFVAVLLWAVWAFTALLRVLALFFLSLFWLKCELRLFYLPTSERRAVFILPAAFLMLPEMLVMLLLSESCAIWEWGFGRSVKEERNLTAILCNVSVL